MRPLQQLLLNAKREIVELRRRNEVLAAHAYVVDVFAAALGRTGPESNQRASGWWEPDVVGALETEIDRLSRAEKDAKSTRDGLDGIDGRENTSVAGEDPLAPDRI